MNFSCRIGKIYSRIATINQKIFSYMKDYPNARKSFQGHRVCLSHLHTLHILHMVNREYICYVYFYSGYFFASIIIFLFCRIDILYAFRVNNTEKGFIISAKRSFLYFYQLRLPKLLQSAEFPPPFTTSKQRRCPILSRIFLRANIWLSARRRLTIR